MSCTYSRELSLFYLTINSVRYQPCHSELCYCELHVLRVYKNAQVSKDLSVSKKNGAVITMGLNDIVLVDIILCRNPASK